jgi:hypothetical protein
LRQRRHFTIQIFVLWNLSAEPLLAISMPIRPYLDGHKFDGRAAFAQCIIALAKAGERDPERLCEGALSAVSTADPSGWRRRRRAAKPPPGS